MLGLDWWKCKIHFYSRSNTLFWMKISKMWLNFAKRKSFGLACVPAAAIIICSSSSSSWSDPPSQQQREAPAVREISENYSLLLSTDSLHRLSYCPALIVFIFFLIVHCLIVFIRDNPLLMSSTGGVLERQYFHRLKHFGQNLWSNWVSCFEAYLCATSSVLEDNWATK